MSCLASKTKSKRLKCPYTARQIYYTKAELKPEGVSQPTEFRLHLLHNSDLFHSFVYLFMCGREHASNTFRELNAQPCSAHIRRSRCTTQGPTSDSDTRRDLTELPARDQLASLCDSDNQERQICDTESCVTGKLVRFPF